MTTEVPTLATKPHASLARHLLRHHISTTLNDLKEQGTLQNIAPPINALPFDTLYNITPITADKLPTRPQWSSKPWPSDARVCIVGAGVAGLYAGQMLQRLGIPFEILEASSRPGGRLMTHYFSGREHDYYDVGSMRFPVIPTMDRTFKLFEKMQLKLTEYRLTGPANPKHYNGITVYPSQRLLLENREFRLKAFISKLRGIFEVIADSKAEHQAMNEDKDPFCVSHSKAGPVCDEAVSLTPGIMEEAYRPFREAIKADPMQGYEMLMKEDDYSVREYLRDRLNLDFHTVQWLERTEGSTSLFDYAFTERVIDSLAFDYGPEEEKWKCIDGGATKLTEAMIDSLTIQPPYNKRVTRMALDRHRPAESRMVVTCNYTDDPRCYSDVINTTTLPCLRRVDTTDLGLDPVVKMSLRALKYDNATKVAIKFAHQWWREFGIVSGGVAHTDLPISGCVYPSYNIHDDPRVPAALLCSYTSQDAARIGSLVSGHSPHGEEELKSLMLHNLALLHTTDRGSFEVLHTKLQNAYITHHAYDWSADDFCSGAYAMYGPGQFKTLYPSLITPQADARFHIAGEAASANHAWVVGALESALHTVFMVLERHRCYGLQERLVREYGECVDVEGGEGGFAHLLVMLGRADLRGLATARARGSGGAGNECVRAVCGCDLCT